MKSSLIGVYRSYHLGSETTFKTDFGPQLNIRTISQFGPIIILYYGHILLNEEYNNCECCQMSTGHRWNGSPVRTVVVSGDTSNNLLAWITRKGVKSLKVI